MIAFDAVNKCDIEFNSADDLVEIMRKGRQVDWYLKSEKTDDDGYITWDIEHWSSIDKNRFIRCYSYKGRVLGESTGHNIYDLRASFFPEEALKVEIS